MFLEITKAVLVHCNTVNNDYEHDSRILYTFLLNKCFSQLLHISPLNLKFLKTFISDFSYIKVWFTNENSKPLETEDKK